MAKPLPFIPEIGVLGTGSRLGSRRIDNATLRGMVSNYDESSGDFGAWVERVTHIQSRGFCAPGESVGTMGIAAAQSALEASGVPRDEVDLVLLGSFTMTELYPGDGVDIARSINPRCGYVALNAGCAGSIYGMGLAASMVRAGWARNVMVVGAEHLTGATNMADPITAILFGDGAGAVLIGRRKAPAPGSGWVDRVILKHDYAPGNIMMSNANLTIPDRVVGPAPGRRHGVAVERQALVMEGGPRVLRNAVNAMAEATVELLGYTMDDLKNEDPGLREALGAVHLVPHQANGRIVDGLQEKLGLAEDRVYRTVYHAGNMSAATNVVTLDYAMREGNLRRREREDGTAEVLPCGRRLQKGDLVVMVTIGAGYLYGAVGFRL